MKKTTFATMLIATMVSTSIFAVPAHAAEPTNQATSAQASNKMYYVDKVYEEGGRRFFNVNYYNGGQAIQLLAAPNGNIYNNTNKVLLADGECMGVQYFRVAYDYDARGLICIFINKSNMVCVTPVTKKEISVLGEWAGGSLNELYTGTVLGEEDVPMLGTMQPSGTTGNQSTSPATIPQTGYSKSTYSITTGGKTYEYELKQNGVLYYKNRLDSTHTATTELATSVTGVAFVDGKYIIYQKGSKVYAIEIGRLSSGKEIYKNAESINVDQMGNLISLSANGGTYTSSDVAKKAKNDL